MSAETLFQRTILMLQAGDPRATTLLAQLEQFPEYVPGWLALGEMLDRSGHRDAALASFGRAARAQPPSSAALHRFGQCLARCARNTEAMAAFARAVQIDPHFAQAWYSLALLQQDSEDHAAAAISYQAALRAKPDFHEAALNLGVALQEQGMMEPAIDAYALALHLARGSFGRIAQSLTSGRCGTLWLDPARLRAALVERHLATRP